MTSSRLRSLTFIFCLLTLGTSLLQADDSCKLPDLAHQKRDAATIQRLDEAWSRAYLRGDTKFMGCLLIPGYVEIMRSGALKFRPDELQMAAKNKGKNLPIPELPKTTVLLHDNVAVAYGEALAPDADGKPKGRRFADFYVWENGEWHVFFSQQAPVETP